MPLCIRCVCSYWTGLASQDLPVWGCSYLPSCHGAWYTGSVQALQSLFQKVKCWSAEFTKGTGKQSKHGERALMDGAGGWREGMHFFWLAQQGQLGWKSWMLKVVRGPFFVYLGSSVSPWQWQTEDNEIFIIKRCLQEKKIYSFYIIVMIFSRGE